MSNNRIITEARSWIGTRFAHQGRVKKSENNRGGCDCVGLIIGVADNVGITCNGKKFSELDRSDYAKIPDGSQLFEAFCQHLNKIPLSEIKPADILMFRFDKDPQHVGFVSDFGDGLGVIHCYLQARGVVEHRLDEYWLDRVVAAFRFR